MTILFQAQPAQKWQLLTHPNDHWLSVRKPMPRQPKEAGGIETSLPCAFIKLSLCSLLVTTFYDSDVVSSFICGLALKTFAVVHEEKPDPECDFRDTRMRQHRCT